MQSIKWTVELTDSTEKAERTFKDASLSSGTSAFFSTAPFSEGGDDRGTKDKPLIIALPESADGRRATYTITVQISLTEGDPLTRKHVWRAALPKAPEPKLPDNAADLPIVSQVLTNEMKQKVLTVAGNSSAKTEVARMLGLITSTESLADLTGTETTELNSVVAKMDEDKIVIVAKTFEGKTTDAAKSTNAVTSRRAKVNAEGTGVVGLEALPVIIFAEAPGIMNGDEGDINSTAAHELRHLKDYVEQNPLLLDVFNDILVQLEAEHDKVDAAAGLDADQKADAKNLLTTTYVDQAQNLIDNISEVLAYAEGLNHDLKVESAQNPKPASNRALRVSLEGFSKYHQIVLLKVALGLPIVDPENAATLGGLQTHARLRDNGQVNEDNTFSLSDTKNVRSRVVSMLRMVVHDLPNDFEVQIAKKGTINLSDVTTPTNPKEPLPFGFGFVKIPELPKKP